MSFRILSFLVAVFLLSACAELPPTDAVVARAQIAAQTEDPLIVMRQASEKIAGTPFVGGNKVTLLRDGAATYPAMLASIHAARKRIDMESFLFDQKEGGAFAAALLERRRAGVEVNLIYDAIGSDDTSAALFKKLAAHGVHIVEYNPVDPGSIIDSSINHRDHRKLLLIDGKIAFCGGVNISALYKLKLKVKRVVEGEDAKPPAATDPAKTPWRDTHVKIEGPVVAEFEKLYMQTWRDQKGVPIGNPPATPKTKRGDLWVQAIDGTPDLERYTIYKSLLVAISVARHSVHLTAAFFVPPPDLLAALQDAVKRGVDVTLILPSNSDSDLSMHAQRSYYGDLLESGVKIYEREGAILHAKTAVIDGAWSTVGSSNLDWRSVLFNNECNAIILGPAFGGQMEAMFQDDLKQSRRVDLDQWEDRPLSEMIGEWKSSLLEYFL